MVFKSTLYYNLSSTKSLLKTPLTSKITAPDFFINKKSNFKFFMCNCKTTAEYLLISILLRFSF